MPATCPVDTRTGWIGRLGLLVVLVAAGGCSCGSTVEEIAVDAGEALPEAPAIAVTENDWPWWRGYQGNGIAPADESVPVRWSETENVVWKTPVPGRGHSSPTIVGERIYLTAADDRAEVQSVLCYDRKSGEQLWKTDVHQGGFPRSSNVHQENSHASGTVACDGRRLFVAFLNGGAVHASALDLDGEIVWQEKVGPFDPKWGYAASPVLYKSLVIVAGDNPGSGWIAALNRETGKVHWRKRRPNKSSYSSAAVAQVAGKDQVLLCGAYRVVSLDPGTGEELWSVKGTTETTCGTMVWQDDLVFASGGYPDSETLCVRADGSGEVLWRNNKRAYVPSLLVHDGYLYLVDEGRAYCWEAKTGELAWQARLESGDYRASPILAGGNIYVTNQRGTTYVFKAGPQSFEKVAENRLGDEAYASPAVHRGQLFLRVAHDTADGREEMLYCIGSSKKVAASAAGQP